MSGTILGYSEVEKASIVRAYLGPGGSGDPPLCPLCSEEFSFVIIYQVAPPFLEVNCPGCANGFTWTPSEETRTWSDLHLRYFSERIELNLEIRCPYDDCLVSQRDSYSGRVELRCLFCNRRQWVAISRREPAPESEEPILELDSCLD